MNRDHFVLQLLRDFQRLTGGEKMLCATAGSILLPYPVTGIMLIVSVVWALCHKTVRRQMLQKKGRWVLLAFSLLCLIVPLCYQWYIGLAAGTGIVLVLLFLLFARSVVTEQSYELSLRICCCMSAVSFLFAVGQEVYNALLVHDPNFRSDGGMLNPNYYGMVLEFAILVCVWKLVFDPKNGKTYMMLLGMNIVGLFLCDCRSAWAAVFIAVFLLLYISGHKAYGLFYFTFAALVLIAASTIPGLFPRMDNIGPSFEIRMDVWLTALRGFLMHPLFGRGAMSYMLTYPQTGGFATYHAHNILLDPLLNFGLVGTALLFTYFGMLYRQLWKRWKARLALRSEFSLILAATAVVLIHGMTDVTILWLQTGMFFCLILSGISLKKDRGMEMAV